MCEEVNAAPPADKGRSTVELRITARGERAEQDLESLMAWLAEEAELSGQVRLLRRPPQPGEMGGLAEAVLVALTTGTIGVLGEILKAWLSQRRNADARLAVCSQRSAKRETLLNREEAKVWDIEELIRKVFEESDGEESDGEKGTGGR